MSSTNPKSNKINPSFAYVFILLVTVSLSLYISIKISSVNQEMKEMGNKIEQLFIAHKVYISENKDTIKESIELIQSDPGIVYNDDGTIDTSKWTLFKNKKYGFELLIPDFLELVEYPICKPDEYCKHPDDFFHFIRLENTLPDRHMFSEIQILVKGYEFFTEEHPIIIFGKHHNIKGNILEFNSYKLSNSLSMTVKNKKEWTGGTITFSTNESSKNSKPNKEMKLLFDTILSTFDYY